jgi:hypothetical protein
MILRLGLIGALMLSPLLASQERSAANCCTSGATRISARTVKTLLTKTEPIQAPCCADMMHIKGTLVFSLAVDTNGQVICVDSVSGHPLIIGVAIDSIRQWKFRPLIVRGLKKKFCGKVTLRYEANEYGVRFDVL